MSLERAALAADQGRRSSPYVIDRSVLLSRVTTDECVDRYLLGVRADA